MLLQNGIYSIFLCGLYYELLLGYQIDITLPSFAKDGVSWHVILAFGFE